MRMVEWVPARDESLSAAKTRVDVVAHDGLFSLVDECGGLGATFVTLEEAEMAAENLSPIRRDAPGKDAIKTTNYHKGLSQCPIGS